MQRDLLTRYKCATYVCDKRFLLTLMFVDYAVEPFYYERGLNFYEDGQNYAMASLLSVAGPTLLGPNGIRPTARVFPARGQGEDAGRSECARFRRPRHEVT